MTKDTARASTQPAPLGKPGGPGLFHQKGQGLPTYIQNIRNAVMRKGKSESEATGIAIAMVKKLVATSKDPAVKAAAAKALAEWEADKAKAHAHAADTVSMDLAVPVAGSADGPRTTLKPETLKLLADIDAVHKKTKLKRAKLKSRKAAAK